MKQFLIPIAVAIASLTLLGSCKWIDPLVKPVAGRFLAPDDVAELQRLMNDYKQVADAEFPEKPEATKPETVEAADSESSTASETPSASSSTAPSSSVATVDDAAYTKAKAKFKAGLDADEMEGAKKLFAESVALYPTAPAHFNLGVICTFEAEVADDKAAFLADAKENFEAALAIDPAHEGAKEQLNALSNQG